MMPQAYVGREFLHGCAYKFSVGKDSFGLEWDSGKGGKRFAVFLEPHDRGCAVFVGNHAATCGHKGLSASEFVEMKASSGEYFLDICGNVSIQAEFASENIGQNTFCDVVFGGPEATG